MCPLRDWGWPCSLLCLVFFPAFIICFTIVALLYRYSYEYRNSVYGMKAYHWIPPPPPAICFIPGMAKMVVKSNQQYDR